MKKAEIQIGATYLMHHSSGRTVVKILRTVQRGGYGSSREVTHWIARNLRTGREIEIKSAVKLIKEMSSQD